jgi:hypothetical protein
VVELSPIAHRVQLISGLIAAIGVLVILIVSPGIDSNTRSVLDKIKQRGYLNVLTLNSATSYYQQRHQLLPGHRRTQRIRVPPGHLVRRIDRRQAALHHGHEFRGTLPRAAIRQRRHRRRGAVQGRIRFQPLGCLRPAVLRGQ